jgi:CheY-like chemotaxis protein
LLTGRKLLLADDSVAIQKVIDLTFTDEGMKVTTVGDGDRALVELEGIAPDIVLADVTMPGVDGYELCRLIKQSERLNAIPVILLVGSFEPFNEAKARRVGANDVVTKPFQSIRDLVSRVGSLLGKEAVTDPPTHEYSTLGLARTVDAPPSAPPGDPTADPHVKVMVEASSPEIDSMQDEEVTVLVEAASITEHESPEAAGPSCETDVETQTADTLQLERITDEQLSSRSTPIAYAQDDTIEIEPVRNVEKAVQKDRPIVEASVAATSMDAGETKTTQPLRTPAASDMFSDTLLDLDYLSTNAQPASREGVVLDLDFEESAAAAPPAAPIVETTVQLDAALVDAPPTEVVSGESLVETAAAAAQAHDWSHDWSIVPAASAEKAAPVALREEEQTAEADQAAALAGLSPELIDAIARRVVEQMSEKVVREIAWEVVPDLAELLIKKKLKEEK